MKKAIVLHNPGAGEGEISKQELISQVESAGFKCSYSSTKQFRWENIDTEDIDFLVLAGGDGTVRKIVDVMLQRPKLEKKLPLGLLPFGTANNIAKTLGVSGHTSDIINGWHTAQIRKFDVGIINGLAKPTFFLESFGYGLFPKLMKIMEEEGHDEIDDPRKSLQVALEVVYDLVLHAPVKKCALRLDDADCSGEFLLLEVMNIRSIGPNLKLAPDADPGDGEFDVVLITEKQRKHLSEYLRKKIEGENPPFDFPLLKAKRLAMRWEGKHAHVDDEYRKFDKPVDIEIAAREGLLEFLTPATSK